jgi:hypothetical protein
VRKDAQGRERTVLLSAPIQTFDVIGEASLKQMEKLTPAQKEFQANWNQGAKEVAKGRS